MRTRFLPVTLTKAATIAASAIVLFTTCGEDFFGPLGPPYDPRPYITVSYNLNGGSGSTPSPQTSKAGTSVTIRNGSGFSRSGYTFNDWNTGSSGSGSNYSAGSSFTPTANITLYARWSSTVTYNINGGSGSTPSSQTVSDGSSVSLAYGGNFSRSGYTFAGWSTNSSGTGTNYSSGSSLTPSGNVTLYARWTSTITYNLNGGSGTTPSSQSVDAGNCVAINSGSNFSRSGYTFAGWNTNSSGTGNDYSTGSSICPSGSITLYARWIPVYTIMYHIDGGSGTTPLSQTVDVGNSVTLNSGSGFSRSGYTFVGWNTNSSGSGTNYSAGSSFTPTGNITLYARWNLQPGSQFNPNISYGSISYGGQTYRTVIIGGKIWMAENLNYAGTNNDIGVCYNNDPSNCDFYGRLYTWAEVMNISSTYNSSTWGGSDVNHRGICPVGWHVPSHDEWSALVNAVGSPSGNKLKSTSWWYNNGNGTDDYGFSALPGGYRWSGSFDVIGNYGIWWSATEDDATDARYRDMHYYFDYVYSSCHGKTAMFSLRCSQD
jgi:uncharacterized protein (TIGR02145 family)/uncharacterized repeat protein (TIGR02543 family)